MLDQLIDRHTTTSDGVRVKNPFFQHFSFNEGWHLKCFQLLRNSKLTPVVSLKPTILILIAALAALVGQTHPSSDGSILVKPPPPPSPSTVLFVPPSERWMLWTLLRQ